MQGLGLLVMSCALTRFTCFEVCVAELIRRKLEKRQQMSLRCEWCTLERQSSLCLLPLLKLIVVYAFNAFPCGIGKRALSNLCR